MSDKSTMYEINTLTWLGELSRTYAKLIKLGSVPAEQWDRLKRLGFDYVWLMGVWKRSREGVKLFRESPEWPRLRARFDPILPGWTDEEVTGSPYSVASYTPEPRIGTWTDIDSVRGELHNRGMMLVLDFVPNHTAPDHPWVFEHPAYYIQGGESDFKQNPAAYIPVQKGKQTLYIARGKDPYFPPWPDMVQLSYFSQEARSALIGELKKITDHCDGVRCDMAMLVLNDIFKNTWGWARKNGIPDLGEFWEEVRRELPGFLLIAEAYWDLEWRLQQIGFDYVYDKQLYDRLLSASGPDVILHLGTDLSYQKKLVRFIENHDEPRSAGVFGKKHLQAAAVLFSALPGMTLYHHGQIEGRTIHIPILLSRAKEEPPDEAVKTFYEKVLSLILSDAFRKGEWRLLEVLSAGDDSFSNIVAFRWKWNDQLKLVVVNLGSGYSQGRISLSKELTSNIDYILIDELNDQQYVRNGTDMAGPGLHVVLEGFDVHVFDVNPLS
jgi:Alpha amylase, catalytic domain